MSNTSSWTLNDKELPFAPAPYSAVPAMVYGNQLQAYQIILENKDAEKTAEIPVEKINGSIFLLSLTNDKSRPSREMSDIIIERLKSNGFTNYFEHIKVERGHTEPIKHFDSIFAFLEKAFPVE